MIQGFWTKLRNLKPDFFLYLKFVIEFKCRTKKKTVKVFEKYKTRIMDNKNFFWLLSLELFFFITQVIFENKILLNK